MILIDNAAHSFALQINNGFPILPFYDNKNDNELIHLTHFLKRISDIDDIRTLLSETFWMTKFIDSQICDTVGGVIEYTVEELDDLEYLKIKNMDNFKTLRT